MEKEKEMRRTKVRGGGGGGEENVHTLPIALEVALLDLVVALPKKTTCL